MVRPHLQSNSENFLHLTPLTTMYFHTKDRLQLLTNNFVSILYYNSDVWQLTSIKPQNKQMLLSALTKAIRVAMHFHDSFKSYINLHKITNRVTLIMPLYFLRLSMEKFQRGICLRLTLTKLIRSVKMKLELGKQIGSLLALTIVFMISMEPFHLIG